MDGGKRCFHVEENVRLQCFRSEKKKPSSWPSLGGSLMDWSLKSFNFKTKEQ